MFSSQSTRTNRKVAMRRLKRDLIELQRTDLPSIAARPLDDNFFEWHANIKATEGAYSGLYFHLILTFPESYPTNPPKVKICTPIAAHPNVFGGWICLSMLRQETGNVPYEGWSGAYSVTSVLMQLQSFLFAKNIDQDEGYTVKARTSSRAIEGTRSVCTQFNCTKCSHSHSSPWPPVISTKIIGIRPVESRPSLTVDGTSCRSTSVGTYTVGNWDGVYGEFGCSVGKVFYEATISARSFGRNGQSRQSRSPFVRIGFGTKNAKICGQDQESIGYYILDGGGRIFHGGRSTKTTMARTPPSAHSRPGHQRTAPTLKWRTEQWRKSISLSLNLDIYDSNYRPNGWYKGVVVKIGSEGNGHDGEVKVHYDGYGVKFDEWLPVDSDYLAPICWHTSTEGDTITVAIDFSGNVKRVYFAVNGRLDGSGSTLPDQMRGKCLYPMVSMLDARIDINFDAPRRPCQWLMDHGFTSLEQAAVDTKCVAKTSTMKCTVDWHSEGVIDELWLWIFECLSAAEVFRAQRVCRKWRGVMVRYNVAERNELNCYFSKMGRCTETLGIGLEIKPNDSGFGVSVLSQMDILSRSAWSSGCRLGVWGERLTHFMPMVMDRAHSDRAHGDIISFLGQISNYIRQHTVISNPNVLEVEIANNATLRLTDSLISMMNSIVVQFVMKNDSETSREMKTLRTRNYYDAKKASKSINMTMCEKVVIGYSAFHHLLLYLKHKNKELITSFANRTVSLFLGKIQFDGKRACKDLGKLLIWTMISSKYHWKDIAKLFMIESFTRRVKWMVKEPKYAKYDTTNYVAGRVQDTFKAATTSRRLVMFQVWFSRSNAIETLQSYNHRLGRPRSEVRHGVMAKTKAILNSNRWSDYFKELKVVIDRKQIDDLLRFAVYNSAQMRYHRPSQRRCIESIEPPTINGWKLQLPSKAAVAAAKAAISASKAAISASKAATSASKATADHHKKLVETVSIKSSDRPRGNVWGNGLSAAQRTNRRSQPGAATVVRQRGTVNHRAASMNRRPRNPTRSQPPQLMTRRIPNDHQMGPRPIPQNGNRQQPARRLSAVISGRSYNAAVSGPPIQSAASSAVRRVPIPMTTTRTPPSAHSQPGHQRTASTLRTPPKLDAVSPSRSRTTVSAKRVIPTTLTVNKSPPKKSSGAGSGQIPPRNQGAVSERRVPPKVDAVSDAFPSLKGCSALIPSKRPISTAMAPSIPTVSSKKVAVTSTVKRVEAQTKGISVAPTVHSVRTHPSGRPTVSSPTLKRALRYIGGVDISVDGTDTACAALTIYEYPSMKRVHYESAVVPMKHQHIAGFLAFRETCYFANIIKKVQRERPHIVPDVIWVDAKRLMTTFSRIDNLKTVGSFCKIRDAHNKPVGYALRINRHDDLVFVSRSPGHRISLESALKVVMMCQNVIIEDRFDDGSIPNVVQIHYRNGGDYGYCTVNHRAAMNQRPRPLPQNVNPQRPAPGSNGQPTPVRRAVSDAFTSFSGRSALSSSNPTVGKSVEKQPSLKRVEAQNVISVPRVPEHQMGVAPTVHRMRTQTIGYGQQPQSESIAHSMQQQHGGRSRTVNRISRNVNPQRPASGWNGLSAPVGRAVSWSDQLQRWKRPRGMMRNGGTR